jgi:lysophospholipase L1-like esterase
VLFAALLLLSACGGGDETTATPSAPSGDGAPPPASSASTPIVAWGDSFTAGDAASSPSASYPSDLARITGREVHNEGVSGQTSEQIAARQGGEPALVSLVEGLLPPAGVAVVRNATPWPVTPPGRTLSGSLMGIHGVMSLNSGGLPVPIGVLFQRDGVGSAQTIPDGTPFIPDTAQSRAWVNILWMGRNDVYSDPDRIVGDVRACVAFLQTGAYVVLPIFNGDGEGRGTAIHDTITSVNAQLAAEFGDHYLDLRRIFLAHADPANAQDQADVAQDVPPSSLRGNWLHPNDAGYLLAASEIARFLAERGW